MVRKEPSLVWDRLEQDGRISLKDGPELRRVWEIRNAAVHPGRPPTPEEVERMIDLIEGICIRYRVQNGIFAHIVLKAEPFRESEEDYAALLVSLRDAIQPIGGLEELLVEKLAFLTLRLSRVYKADAKVAPLLFDGMQKSLTEKSSLPIMELLNWQKEVDMVRKDCSPELLLRYETSLERQFDRILTQLERAQLMRLGQPVLPPVKVEVST